MTPPDRAQAIVLGWARAYTRGVDPTVRERRLAELASDCHEQRFWGGEVGASPVAVATSMVARTLAGMPADLLWRQAQAATSRDRSPNPRGRPMGRWIKDNWWVALATLAGTMFTVSGLLMPFEGEVEGGPPWWVGMLLMLAFGFLLLGGAWARRRRRVTGDVMIVFGTLPLFPLFWTIVLPLLGMLIAIPAIVDAADVRAIGKSAGGTSPPEEQHGQDRASIVLLALMAIAVAVAAMIGQGEMAYVLVSPPLSLFAAHVTVRRATMSPPRRLGLTAMVAGVNHAILTVAVVAFADPGTVDLSRRLPSLTTALVEIAAVVGLFLFVLGGRSSRDRARPA